jgi:hypothetical protein
MARQSKKEEFEVQENKAFIFSTNSDNENAPAYRGQINVGGDLFRITLWERDAKYGTMLSGTIMTEEEYQEQLAEYKAQNDNGDDFDYGENKKKSGSRASAGRGKAAAAGSKRGGAKRR